MNNLEEWENAKRIVKEAWEDWKPHFEILESANGEKILAFFLLNDTDIEWRLYHDAPEEISEDFADYMEDAKEELLKHIGFNTEIEEEKMNNETAIELTEELEKCMRVYERKQVWICQGLLLICFFIRNGWHCQKKYLKDDMKKK